MRKLIALAMLVVFPACFQPYGAPAEKLKTPKAKKGSSKVNTGVSPEEAAECTYDFEGPEVPARPNPKAAMQKAQEVENNLNKAKLVESPLERRDAILEALDTLSGAFKKDPYSPEVTYQMAVAYALVGKVRCSTAMLERLATLVNHVEVGEKATKLKAKARKDAAFNAFREDANTALGN